MRVHWLIPLCTALLQFFLLSGCTKLHQQLDLNVSLDDSRGPLKISRVYWAPYAISTLAQEKGLFKKAGVDVEISVFPDVVDSRRAFERGGMDAAMLTPFTYLMTKEIGVDSVITMVLDYSEGADGIVARPEIGSAKDLKGKNVGVEVGTIAHFTLLKALESAGLKEEDIHIFNIRTDDLISAFKNKRVDAVASWDPYLNRIVTQENGHLVFTTKQSPDIISDIFVVNRKSYERRRPDWVKFHAAWLEAIDEFKRNPMESAKLMSSFEHQSADSLVQNMSGIRLLSHEEQIRFLGDGTNPAGGIKHIKDYQLFMKKNGLLSGSYDLSNVLQADLIRDAI